MTLTFASPADLTEEFRNLVLGFGLLDVVIIAAFTYHSRGLALSVSFKARCVLGLLGFLAAVWYAYASSYQKFTSAEVTPVEIRLQFVGPFAREVVLPRHDIEAVRFGMPDKGKKCRLTVESRSSSTFRSAWLPDRADTCKALRDDVLRVLGSEAQLAH